MLMEMDVLTLIQTPYFVFGWNKVIDICMENLKRLGFELVQKFLSIFA